MSDEFQQTQSEFAEFVRVGALYEKHTFARVPSNFQRIRPHVLTLNCPICKRENPFRIPERKKFRKAPDADINNKPSIGVPSSPGTAAGVPLPAQLPALESRVYTVGLTCTGCEKFEFVCWIEVDGAKGWARKVGQIPGPSVKVPRDLNDALGQGVELYRRAKVCLNQSYGVGACAYLRRLLEDRVAPMLEIVYEMKKEDGASSEELEKIAGIMRGKVASDKIALASGVWPASITTAGDNPVKLIYDDLSNGLHSRDETECVRRARESLPIVEHILTELSTERQRRQSQRQFADRVRSIRNSRNAEH